MAPRGSKPDDPFVEDDWGPETDAQGNSDEMPDATVDPDRAAFLKPWHLEQRQGTFELTGASGATEYSDVVLHLKVGRKAYRLGLRTFDPAYAALVKKYGKKRTEWKGTLRYKIMPHKGKPDGFVAVRPA
jgi:hypothetical protein